MSYVGIVGAEAAKFTIEREAKARLLIRQLLAESDSVLVSGGCHLGGIDIWAEEEARLLGRDRVIFKPQVLNWLQGFKPRNIQIATKADVVHNIVVATYPADYTSMRFEICYHCRNRSHVKSGGCWTAHYARSLQKRAYWHILV